MKLYVLVSRIIADQEEFCSFLLKFLDDIHFLHHAHLYDAERSGTTFIVSKCLRFISIFKSIPDTLGSRFISVGGLVLRLSHFRSNLGPCNSVKITCFLWQRLVSPSEVSCQHPWWWKKADGLSLSDV